MILSGGITPLQIPSYEKKYNFLGYDVQSYCRENGNYHFGKIERLVRTVKGQISAKFSISLTDNNTQIPDYSSTANLEYQLDYSDGSLYCDFVTNKPKNDRCLQKIDAPFTLHVFTNTNIQYQRVIDDYMEKFSNKIVRVNIQYSDNINIEEIKTYNALKCISVYHKDFKLFLRKNNTPKFDCVSIILPHGSHRKKAFLDYLLTSNVTAYELWVDRNLQINDVNKISNLYPKCNYIIGKYITKDWPKEKTIGDLLNERL
ncbi:MAG: hypothetical protein LBU20_02550 [Candidatus Nomurabacteria bacterium]|jgi:hypothetical protein|nr:hypothetical protein [Candidatus Nomurabacteria bacterium]